MTRFLTMLNPTMLHVVKLFVYFQRKIFIRSAKVFPFIVQTGWKPNPHMYRKVVGTTEVVCGMLLACVPGNTSSMYQAILICSVIFTLGLH